MIKKFKTGDKVIVLAGKNKGKIGKIIQVFPESGKLVVEGVNILKKHLKTRKAGQKGQIIELPAPFYMSKAALYCERCARGVRSGFRQEAENKVRFCKKCNEVI